MDKKDIHYRLPLKLISSYIWADLNYPGKAILPVIGVYIDLRINQGRPGIRLISELSGYGNLGYVRIGINDLIAHNLIIRQKESRHYIYSLTDLSFCKRGSFFPIYKEAMILSGKWSESTSSEKSLYPVLGNKAKINDPEALELGYHAIGDIYEPKKYIRWAGISRMSFYRAYYSLNHKGLIDSLEGGEGYYRYGIYAPK